MTLYLSRLMLNRYAPTRALSGLLDPADAEARSDASHRLIWTLFGDGHDRARDFLWRADGRGRFFTLSSRPPLANDLFCPPETKVFAPDLRQGDMLHFVLRANATRAKRQAEGPSARVDVVMDLLHGVPRDERAVKRDALAQEAATAWMTRQGATKGFELAALSVEDYRVARIPRGRKTATLGVLDMSGTLRVTDPAALVAGLGQGFGRGKAWGCGLMLIRRARAGQGA